MFLQQAFEKPGYKRTRLATIKLLATFQKTVLKHKDVAPQRPNVAFWSVTLDSGGIMILA